VSGTLGDAALGLRVLNGLALPDEEAIPLVDRYRTPRPRLELGRALRGLATAAIDVSDGLIADLGHVAETSASRPSSTRTPFRCPRPHAAFPPRETRRWPGGDDYELLFTAPPEAGARLEAVSRELGLRLTRIGRDRGRGWRARGRRGRRGGEGRQGGVEPLLNSSGLPWSYPSSARVRRRWS
jgi:thiamine-monophosphate kinase